VGELKRLPSTGRDPKVVRRYREGDIIADKYQLVRLIGTGGMGTVWIAHNLALDVQVAIKLIRGESASPASSGRLLQEARAAARLGHPGIVRVFDFGRTSHDEPFIVMELLDGESLADVLDRRKRINATRSVQMLLPIADALSVAHSKGIVHRDLKPENVYLHRIEGGRSQPKIVDFGIALLERAGDGRITQDGAVMGSPSYMSPEQARGEDQVDHRADIWSFAVVLYETMTGQPAFDGQNNLAILRQVVERAPLPVTELGAGDDGLWAIIDRALRKDRDERWQSMRAMGSALALWLTHQGVEEDICGASLSATWLNADAGKGALSSRPPPANDALGSPPQSLRVSPPPSLSLAQALDIEEARQSSRGRRRSFKALMMLLLVAALVVVGFVLTRNLLSSGRLVALAQSSPSPVPTAVAPPAAQAPVAPVTLSNQQPPAAVAEPTAAAEQAEPPQAEPPPEPPRPAPRARRAASKPAVNDLKMPY